MIRLSRTLHEIYCSLRLLAAFTRVMPPNRTAYS